MQPVLTSTIGNYVRLLATTIALSITPLVGAANAGSPVDVVKVEGGLLRGVATDVPGVQVFKGVPFAGPTGGENRFKPPQPVQKWDGVKVADHWGDQALQDIHGNPVGQFWGDEFYFDPAFMPKAGEEGLNLNVWTPAASTTDKLPVYVWIHGGANHHGYASEMEFYASKLAAKGIIVVAIQYRVGALGFLALPELSQESPQKVSGNYAMLDQIKALQWVHDNIAGFGGDPDNVTIGGQSAGARNSTMLLRSPLAKGLFHRAVIESGFTGFFASPMMPLAERETANAKAIEQVFGKPMTLADLRRIPTDDFISKMAADGKTQLYEALHKATNIPAQHAIDGYVFTNESIDLLRPGALDGLDIMIGGTSNEYSSLNGGPDKTMSQSEFDDAMKKIGYDDGWQKVYRPSDPREAYRMWLRARADYNLQNYLVSSELVKSRNRNLHVYDFYFNHAPPGRDSEFYGSFHSSDLWYFMNSMRDAPGQRAWTGADYRMAEIMSSYLANFVKTGNPNGSGLPEWQQTSADTGGTFMWFRDGYAHAANQTPYPERDGLNRRAVMETQHLSGSDLPR
jgi:para-nitrobenzyl esterase